MLKLILSTLLTLVFITSAPAATVVLNASPLDIGVSNSGSFSTSQLTNQLLPDGTMGYDIQVNFVTDPTNSGGVAAAISAIKLNASEKITPFSLYVDGVFAATAQQFGSTLALSGLFSTLPVGANHLDIIGVAPSDKSLAISGNIVMNDPVSVSAVPVPAAVWLFGSSIVGMLFTRRKSR